jgi:hypothetical protein
MERASQDGDHAMEGRKVEDTHDLERAAYSWGNIIDQ